MGKHQPAMVVLFQLGAKKIEISEYNEERFETIVQMKDGTVFGSSGVTPDRAVLAAMNNVRHSRTLKPSSKRKSPYNRTLRSIQ